MASVSPVLGTCATFSATAPLGPWRELKKVEKDVTAIQWTQYSRTILCGEKFAQKEPIISNSEGYMYMQGLCLILLLLLPRLCITSMDPAPMQVKTTDKNK